MLPQQVVLTHGVNSHNCLQNWLFMVSAIVVHCTLAKEQKQKRKIPFSTHYVLVSLTHNLT